MDRRTNTSAFRIHAPSAWRSLIIVILVFPLGACARTPLAKLSPAPTEEADCFAISTLPEKRECLAKRDDAFIADCERMRPMSCRPYREMYSAEETLRQAETSLLQAAQQAYGSYTEDDPAYLDDLSASAREASAAWRAYREAQCTLEPLAQGMARGESENLTETCRLAKTQERIAELEALKASTRK